MNRRTDCVILRKIPYRESSLIVNTFSRDYGRLDFILKGARGIGAKKFPSAELFRELSVEFRAPRAESDIFHLSGSETVASFDGVASRTENYLVMCTFAAFLLKHTAPFLTLPATFSALLALLGRLSAEDGPAFRAAAAKLVFLNESGLLPDEFEDGGRRGILNALLEYGSDRSAPKPELADDYERKLISWIDSLCVYHGLV